MKSLNKIALDIVLLLPKEIKDLCISMDHGSERSKEVSFENGYEPHITLSMGCVKMSDVSEISEKVADIVQTEKPLELSITDFHEGKSSWLDIAKSEALFALHQKMNAIMKNYSSYDAVEESFFEGAILVPKQTLINWVNNYPLNVSDEKYDPHISMGSEKAYTPDFPIHFVADTIGMFQLSFHGTCKNKLAEFKLNSQP